MAVPTGQRLGDIMYAAIYSTNQAEPPTWSGTGVDEFELERILNWVPVGPDQRGWFGWKPFAKRHIGQSYTWTIAAIGGTTIHGYLATLRNVAGIDDGAPFEVVSMSNHDLPVSTTQFTIPGGGGPITIPDRGAAIWFIFGDNTTLSTPSGCNRIDDGTSSIIAVYSCHEVGSFSKTHTGAADGAHYTSYILQTAGSRE
jgi:hypothetical protein